IVQTPFMKETDPATKSGVVQKLLPRALWWFRYGALVTVLSGLIIVSSHFTHGHGHGILSTSWGISIAIGGGLGIIMFLNVWLMIVQACGRLRVILAAAAGVLLLLCPQSSLSEEPNLALGPLPNMPIPAYNLQTDAKVELGKMLFFDTRLSKGNAISCAFCHNPGTGWADSRQFSVGVGGGQGGRQAPTVLNTGYQTFQFWDGRAGSLEEQVLGPIQNPIEMAETLPGVVKKLSAVPEYRKRFKEVF